MLLNFTKNLPHGIAAVTSEIPIKPKSANLMNTLKRLYKMKNKFLALVVLAVACVGGSHIQVQAQPAPLSCNMKMMLTGVTAMLRDQGTSRKDAKIANDPNSELTKKEIKTILDRVYIAGKNQTPDQIKDDVYKRCKNGR